MSVGGQCVGRIGSGLLIYLGVAAGDGAADIEYIVSKARELRIFEDADGKMNRSVVDAGGGILMVSQFTLSGDARRGRRPSFAGAEVPVVARERYEQTVAALRSSGLAVETGVFQADMLVSSINNGPVTILLDSSRLF